MKSFRDLKVWEKAHVLVLECYRLTRTFPKEELFGLVSQIRRAAVSVPANIAEGCARGSNADFQRFLQMAMGSASVLSRDLNLLKNQDFEKAREQVEEVKRMLSALIRKIALERA
jgi:four helix bundle protein